MNWRDFVTDPPPEGTRVVARKNGSNSLGMAEHIRGKFVVRIGSSDCVLTPPGIQWVTEEEWFGEPSDDVQHRPFTAEDMKAAYDAGHCAGWSRGNPDDDWRASSHWHWHPDNPDNHVTRDPNALVACEDVRRAPELALTTMTASFGEGTEVAYIYYAGTDPDGFPAVLVRRVYALPVDADNLRRYLDQMEES